MFTKEIEASFAQLRKEPLTYYRALKDPIGPVRARAKSVQNGWAKSEGWFRDYVIYLCPVRGHYAFAMLDRAGRYWTACEWHICGMGWTDPGAAHSWDTMREMFLKADGKQGRPLVEGTPPLEWKMLEGHSESEIIEMTQDWAVEYMDEGRDNGTWCWLDPTKGRPWENELADAILLDEGMPTTAYMLARAGVIYRFDKEYGAGAFMRSVGSAKVKHKIRLAQLKKREAGRQNHESVVTLPTDMELVFEEETV